MPERGTSTVEGTWWEQWDSSGRFGKAEAAGLGLE